ncbi:sporulation histidine kinase inhibitor Sda [Bacillus sp. 7884-1]
MQNLSVVHLVEILNRSIELNLQKEFIDLIVGEITNKRNTL